MVIRLLLTTALALAACDGRTVDDPPPDAGSACLGNVNGCFVDARDEKPLDVRCESWCRARESCTGQPWDLCVDRCLVAESVHDVPSVLDEEPCPDGR